MSTPPPANNAAPSEHASPPLPERTYSRVPPAGLGDRLASARRLPPVEAPPPPPRNVVGTDAGDSTLFPSASAPLDTDMATSYIPKYGIVKGSYISPFDSGGKTPGDKRLSASSISYEEFEAKYGSSARASAGEDSPSEASDRTIGPSDKGMGHAVSVSEKVVVPPEGAKNRHLFLGPLRLVRKACTDKADTIAVMKDLGNWLDVKMPEALQTVIKRDAMIKEVVFIVSIPMTDEDWLNYNQVLPFFPDALDMQNLLALGKDELDKVTQDHRELDGLPQLQRHEPQLTYPQLTEPGLTLEEILSVMVKRQALGQPWDWDKMGQRPELVPKEYGGTMEGYPLG